MENQNFSDAGMIRNDNENENEDLIDIGILELIMETKIPVALVQWKIYSGTATGKFVEITSLYHWKKIMWMTEGIAEFCDLGLLLC